MYKRQLQWFDNKPLFGKTIVVTRARAQASALTRQLEAAGARVIEAPAIKIIPPEDYTPLDKAIENIKTYKWLILTSANGVTAFFNRLDNAGLDSRSLSDIKIAAIGSETAKALKNYGISADLVPPAFKAEELAETLSAEVQVGDKILLARAKVAREVLPESLRALGASVDVVTAYETVTALDNKEELLTALQNGEVDLVTFTSSSTVTNLLASLGDQRELINNIPAAAIGPVTAETCRQNNLEPDIIAETFTIAGLTDAIQRYYKE